MIPQSLVVDRGSLIVDGSPLQPTSRQSTLSDQRPTTIDQRGFTIIEVLVSLSLVALLFTVLIVAVSAGMAKVREAGEDTPVVAWVASAMDAAMALGINGLPPGGRYDARRILGGAPELPAGVRRADLTVAQISTKPILKEVTIAAFRAGSAEPAFALTTIVGPRP
ncbi:MAG TPA: prepilin-type N-terminal cleavage/methylation domain-containing protein [bacterium]|jgi:prepilin-type N-terminal cleavage/methylation domain-containing protein